MEKDYSDGDIEGCRRANYFKKLDEKRVNALGSRNALKYYKLCDEMGVDPEDKQLYEFGMMEDSKSSRSQARGLERKAQEGPVIVPKRKTSKITEDVRKRFYQLANEHDVVPGRLDDQKYASMIDLLSNVLKIRSLNAEGGKMPIYSCDPNQVRAKYLLEYGLAQRQFEPEKFEKTLARVIFYSTLDRGFSLEDYSDYILEAAKSLGLKESELPKGDNIIDYARDLLRKHKYPVHPEIY